jgi:phytoene dehydrogenase-like protein
MGTVTHTIAAGARQHGARLEVHARVERVIIEGGQARGVVLADGRALYARTVVCNADPFRMRELIGRDQLEASYHARLDAYAQRPGSTLKVNMALKGLPRFTCLPEDRGQFGPTIHLLPDETDVMRSIREGFETARRGALAPFPPIEWYIHTALDPSLRDDAGHHTAALFVQWVPLELQDTTWAREEERYTRHLLSICDRFAPGTSDLVVDTFVLHPQKIEQHFGITRGHIHHIDNGFGFADRLPYETPIAGLYSCSAGCHPAGSVIGAAGHNAARRVLRDLGHY